MPIPTMSGLHRGEACPLSMVLSQGRRAPGVDARWGNVVHAYLETRDLAAAPEWARERLSAIDLDSLPPLDNYAQEVAFAFDYEKDTARELGRGLGRNYPPTGPTEVVGTADIIGLTPDAVVCLDVKSGWADLGEPEESLQLCAYSLAAARAYGREKAIVGFIYVREGQNFWHTAELDAFALEETALRIKAIAERYAALIKGTVRAEPNEGTHCRFCPAFDHCPAKARLVNAAAEVEELMTPLTPETVARAVERLELVEQVVKRAWERLEEFARDTPVTLSDGRVYGLTDREKGEIDGEKAAPFLADRYGQEFASWAVERVVTKSSIDRAVRSVLLVQDKRLKLGKAKEAVWDDLVFAGAARVRVTRSVQIHKAGRTSKQLGKGEDNGAE